MAGGCPSTAGQFEELYALYQRPIYRYLYRLVDRTDLADDLTHDVFIQLHRQLDDRVHLLNPRAWLYKVATNLAHNHVRREQRLLKLIKSWMPLLSSSITPESDYARDEMRMLARHAVGRLPIREQTLLQLFQDGLSYAEIAAAADVSPASVGKLLSRAIEKCSRSVKR